MKSISAPLLSLFLLLLGLSSFTNASIKEVCHNAMQDAGEYESFCESSLTSATDGKDDGKESLSKLAMDLTEKALRTNLAKIEKLMKMSDIAELGHKAMDVCGKVYRAAITKMEQAGQRFELKDFSGASNYLYNARDQVVSCTDAISVAGAQAKSLMKDENDAALKFCFVAIHIEATLI